MPSRCFSIKCFGLQTNFERRKYSKLLPVRDALFVKRIKRYIKENRHLKLLDADTLVRVLRNKYPEYGRRQSSAIKGLAGRVIAQLQDDFDYQPIEIEDDVICDDDVAVEIDAEMSCSISSNDLVGESDSSDSSSEIGFVRDDKQNNASLVTNNITHPISQLYRMNSMSHNSSASVGMRGIVCNTSTVSPMRDCNGGVTAQSYTSLKRVYSEDNVKSVKTADSSVLNGKKRKTGFAAESGKSSSEHSINCTVPDKTFADVAGCRKVLSDVLYLSMHLIHPEIFTGMDLPRGFLLHGPPGCGKTLIAYALAGQLQIPLLHVKAPDLVAGISGESEQRIKQLFDTAVKSSPCILFIDQIDAITPNRNTSSRDMERRIVSKLLLCIDELNRNPSANRVLIIGETGRIDSLDPSLRNAGRFDSEVCLGIPDQESRYEILKKLCSSLQLSSNVNLQELSSLTPGYVPADLKALIRVSKFLAMERSIMEATITKTEKDGPVTIDLCDDDGSKQSADCLPSTNGSTVSTNENIQPCHTSSVSNDAKYDKLLSLACNKNPIDPVYLESLYITMADFSAALKRVQPSSKREGFATVPDVTWDDIGSLKDIRKELNMCFLDPIKNKDYFAQFNILAGAGVLLCGPPGCGKTLVAKAMANEAGINFISVKGPELLNMYVGGSEKAIRECFQRARNSKPCIIFFDEFDALCPKRVESDFGGSTSRVVNQLLTEMDGIEGRQGVFLMAATNRPDIIDPAMLRPRRFDKILYVGFPGPDDRLDILRTLTKSAQHFFDEEVDLEKIAKSNLCDGYTGADLFALVWATSSIALQDHHSLDEQTQMDLDMPRVYAKHFESALLKVRPSVSPLERKQYEDMRLKYASRTISSSNKDCESSGFFKSSGLDKLVDIILLEETSKNNMDDDDTENDTENADEVNGSDFIKPLETCQGDTLVEVDCSSSTSIEVSHNDTTINGDNDEPVGIDCQIDVGAEIDHTVDTNVKIHSDNQVSHKISNIEANIEIDRGYDNPKINRDEMEGC